MKRGASGKTAVPDGTVKEPMSQYGFGDAAGRERGGRRKKVFDYLKAANELRQTYTTQLATQITNARDDYNSEYHDTPGAFPDVEIARSGDEEMVLFPSYARKLSPKRMAERRAQRCRRDSTSTIDDYRDSDDLGLPGELDWEEYEMENAVVAVDVRGWLYSPHRGPMTRKHRLMVALARKLSGVPAPSTYAADNAESMSTADVGPGDKVTSQGEDEIVNKEMQSMIKKAESEADAAWKSTAPADRDDGASPGRPPPRRPGTTSIEPTQMTKDELSIANAHLMERLRPFLANPMTDMPVTVFFFNEDQSQSRSIVTDASGHFVLRAALPFIPTHIRVLASENLSAAKEIRIVDPSGVSLISDIDDTVKHSAIANGAKEMFRNTFVRELSELTVDGVSSWYSELARMGVDIHYVSNAPWQLYPLLERFFKMVGLPPGSFHMKQYSGMLQGIFEPTAERKRASLERILEDFPERKFILVGDSGEADLEVYTGIVLTNPGRILGIFIRDVTTSDDALFFEKSVDHLESGLPRSHSTGQLVKDSDTVTNRPALPPRRPTGQSTTSLNVVKSIDNADLIDLNEDGEEEGPKKPAPGRPLPAKPSKPSALRVSTNPDAGEAKESNPPPLSQEAIRRKPAPPVPPRRPTDNTSRPAAEPTPSNGSYASSVMNAVSSVPNLLPAAADYLPGRNKQPPGPSKPAEAAARSKQPPPPPPPRRTTTQTSQSNPSTSVTPQPPQPSQRQQQSYPAAAANAASTAYQFASDRLWPPTPGNVLRPATSTSNPSTARTSSSSVNESAGAPPAPLPNRREELWRRRWERANEVLEQHGVVLGSWRVGSDVQDVCLWLARDALREMRGSKRD